MKEGINLGICDNTIGMYSTDNGAETFDRCLTHYSHNHPSKMLIPGVCPWVKQRNLIASIRVSDFPNLFSVQESSDPALAPDV